MSLSTREIAELFVDARQTGATQWQAKCPAHDDGKASLCIGRGDDGRTLVHCQAGCATEDVLSHKRLSMADLMPDREQHQHNGNGKGRIVATYDYRDERGSVLYRVHRFEPKDFLQQLPSGEWKLGDVRRVLYRLPELLAADRSQTVFIVEGEKDCDRLAKLGLVATCNVGGARKWRSEYGDSLRGRHCVILADNDDPGRAHAAEVKAKLQNVAASAAIVPLPGLPEKGDVSDWLNAGGTHDELMELIASRDDDKPEASPDDFELLSCEEVEASAEEEYLASGLIVRNQPGILAAIYKGMKTSIAVDVCLSLATGGHVLGYFPVPRPVPVLFMSAESGMATLKRTARSVCKAAGIQWPSGIPNLKWCKKLPKMGFDEDLRRLERAYAKFPYEVLVIDPTYKAMSGADASNLFIQGELLLHLSQWCEDRGITLLLVHHLKKTAAASYEPAELAELSFSGFAEHVRWWLLLSRREKYTPPDPVHRLWMSTGGSAGHSGLWSLDIDLGQFEEGRPRQWNVTITEGHEQRRKTAEDRAKAKAADKMTAAQVRAEADIGCLLSILREFPSGQTARGLRGRGLAQTALDIAISNAIDAGVIERCKVLKPGRKTGRDGYRIAQLKPSEALEALEKTNG